MTESEKERNIRIQKHGAKLAMEVMKKWHKEEDHASMWSAVTILIGSLFKISERHPDVIKKELLTNIDRMLEL